MNGQKARRPTITRAAGRIVSIASIAANTPSADNGPSVSGAGNRCHEENEQAETDGRSGRNDRGAGVLERAVHRLMLVLDDRQLFSVPRNEEQRVVGARTENQHGHDPRGRLIDRESEASEEIAESLSRTFRQENRHERNEPEDR